MASQEVWGSKRLRFRFKRSTTYRGPFILKEHISGESIRQAEELLEGIVLDAEFEALTPLHT